MRCLMIWVILLTPLGLDNVEIIQPQSSISTIANRNWQLTDPDKQRLQQDYREPMISQLYLGKLRGRQRR